MHTGKQVIGNSRAKLFFPSFLKFRGDLNRFYIRRVSSSSLSAEECVPNTFRNVDEAEIRHRLTAEVKAALKRKDIFTATTLRSVLSEVYAKDKASKAEVSSSVIISILQKACLTRRDSATQFGDASRPDLAEKEIREANLLSAFLPPPMPQDEIDKVLRQAMDHIPQNQESRKSVGMILKFFYSRVDKSVVDSTAVKRRAEELWQNYLQRPC